MTARGLDQATREKLTSIVPDIPSVPRSFEDVTEQIAPSILLLDTGVGQGTGTVIHRDGLVLTDAHVVKGSGEIVARAPSGTSGGLRLLAMDEAADIALLDGASGLRSHVTLGDSRSVRVGEEIGVGGYPLGSAMEDHLGLHGRSPSFVKGVISAVREERGHRVLQFDAPIAEGYSGGPVFRANTGEVIGLVTGEVVTMRGKTGVCLAVGIDSARALWERRSAGNW